MGRVAVRDLIEHSDLELTVADLDGSKVEAVIKELGDGRLEGATVDVTDRSQLVGLMRRADVVLSCVGPFYKYALAVVEAAIEAERSLVDICDDYDVTPKVLELHEEAKAKGITVITGMGASPGATNLLAKLGAERLDEAEEVRIGLVQSAADPEGGPAVIYHVFHAMCGSVPTYKGGKTEEVRAFVDGEEELEFPGLGSFKVYHIGHPEPLTLPRYIPGLKTVSCKLTLNPPQVCEMILGLEELGFTSEEPLAVKGIELSPLDFSVAYLAHLAGGPLLQGIPYEGAVRVEVLGRKEGRAARVIYTAKARMNEGTGVPVAVGAQMIASGAVREPGVFAPEGCVDAELFLKEMTKRGFKVREELEIREVRDL
jgi:saccharopine dehydrogenase (NAD+, L-lysine-forming)